MKPYFPSTNLRISDLKGELSRVDVEGEVIEKGATRTVNLRAGGQSDVADATIRDDSGSIKLSLWGEQINQIDVGDRVRIENGYTKAFRGEVQLNIGRYGKLVKL
jgi:replication factor A1